MIRRRSGITLERRFSGGGIAAAATFADVQINPYVVMTIQVFRAQLLEARAVGDADRAAAFEAAIRSLLEDSGLALEASRGPISLAS